jgi:hypothetical protein
LEKLEENRIDGEFRSEIAAALGKILVTELNTASCAVGMSVPDNRSMANAIAAKEALA